MSIVAKFATAEYANMEQHGRVPDRWEVSPRVWRELNQLKTEDNSYIARHKVEEHLSELPKIRGIPVDKKHGVTGINAVYED